MNITTLRTSTPNTITSYLMVSIYLYWSKMSCDYNWELSYLILHISIAENTKILRQPGALLLKYPLLWDVAKSTVEKNLRLYGASLPPHTPSTTWSTLTINWLELDERGKAEQFFEKSYTPFVQEPFKVKIKKPVYGTTLKITWS